MRSIGDEDDGQTVVAVQGLEHALDLATGDRVHIARRLVGEQEQGAGDQSAGDGDPLLLITGELVRQVIDTLAQAHANPFKLS